MMDEQRLKDAENSIGLIDCPDCEQGRVSREGTFEDGQDYERCETCDGSGMVSRFPDGHALIAEVRRLQHRLIAWGCRDGHNEDDCPLCSAEHALLNTRESLTEARRVLREVREWHRCPWKHGASVEVLDLTRHAEWIARIDAAVLAQEEK